MSHQTLNHNLLMELSNLKPRTYASQQQNLLAQLRHSFLNSRALIVVRNRGHPHNVELDIQGKRASYA